MRRAVAPLSLALALAACVAPVEPGPAEPAPPGATGGLSTVDRQTMDALRIAGDDPFAVRPVEHTLLETGAADPEGLALAMSQAGFGVPDVQPRLGFEARVVVSSDLRAATLARQIGWLEANAPAFGYERATWTTRPVLAEPATPPAIE